MMLRSLGLTAVITAALAAGAAAPKGPPGPDARQGPPGEGRPRGPQLFISPAGEPFRAPAGAPYPVAAWFSGADADHDGALSRDEFVADALRFFAVLDTDHDGIIDGFEVSNYEQHIAPEIIGGVAPGAMRGGPRGQEDGGGDRPPRPRGSNVLQGAALYGLIAEPEPVMAADGDFDRRVSKAEAVKAAKTRFALLDVNKDGKLTLEELPKTPSQAAVEGGGRPGPLPGGGRGGRGGGRPS
ncbi:EF-hand domain-containing protein [uncultured Caulobacter sp.]|uniref:EF-hand domain-containing protein n=1 Tax=uncultured Caulobacter sp. TaxID=158749 RepID=UPI002629A2AF|nr:EF-hand domain-containing protein [uncultured Caulobacter sp.]